MTFYMHLVHNLQYHFISTLTLVEPTRVKGQDRVVLLLRCNLV